MQLPSLLVLGAFFVQMCGVKHACCFLFLWTEQGFTNGSSLFLAAALLLSTQCCMCFLWSVSDVQHKKRGALVKCCVQCHSGQLRMGLQSCATSTGQVMFVFAGASCSRYGVLDFCMLCTGGLI